MGLFNRTNSTTENTNVDSRVVSGDRSTVNNQTVTGSGNTITDGNAIRLSHELAQGALEYASELSNQALTGVETSVFALRDGSKNALAEVKDAYSEARTGDHRTTLYIFGAIAAAAVLAPVLLRRGKA